MFIIIITGTSDDSFQFRIYILQSYYACKYLYKHRTADVRQIDVGAYNEITYKSYEQMSRNWIAFRESRLDRVPSSKAHARRSVPRGGEGPKRGPHPRRSDGQYKTDGPESSAVSVGPSRSRSEQHTTIL